MAYNDNKRKYQRKLFTTTVDYTYGFRSEGSLDIKTGKGVTTNLSDGGLGFYTYMPFCIGQGMDLHIWQMSRKAIPATVRWCSKVSDSIFKVGLMFN